ncbi:MAG: hypothetical protein JNL18_13130 [Planctomycetaceae bacterium]|nr:hypothetical protein [Planctomycetaceae bacterium]
MGRLALARLAPGHLAKVVTLTLIIVANFLPTGRAALTNPLAFPSLGSFDVGIGNAVTIDTTLGELRVNGILAFNAVIDTQAGTANTAAGIPELAVFSFDSINIGSGVAVTVTGNRGLSLLSRGDVTLRSPLRANGGDFGAASPAGGFAGAADATDGTGPAPGKRTSIGNYAGAGGGGYGGAGGQGGAYTPTDGLGGNPYPVGNSLADSLYGGSGGGAGLNGGTLGLGGGGGGAIEISAIGQVNLFSAVTSNGGQAGVAANGYGGGGGGSGGSVRIAGSKVALNGSAVIAANGSDGGLATGGGGFNAGGGGGGGRVLIQQNAGPLASGVTAAGGPAIGAATPGGDGSVEQVASSLQAGALNLNVRLGTGSASGHASLQRGGSANGAIYGFVDHVGPGFTGPAEGATFAFTGLLGGTLTELVPVTYSTNSRTTETVTVKSNGGNATLATGRGVGPTFATNMGVHPATTINLGSTSVFHSAAFHLILSNASTDLGLDSPLTSLGILGIELSGPDAAAFSVDSLIPALLYEGQHANLPIHFSPTEVRDYHATLTIRTDQGAANGAAGQAFTYQLAGGGVQSIPEPTSLVLAGVVSAAVVTLRRRTAGCG